MSFERSKAYTFGENNVSNGHNLTYNLIGVHKI